MQIHQEQTVVSPKFVARRQPSRAAFALPALYPWAMATAAGSEVLV
jgi:hypothetical protein